MTIAVAVAVAVVVVVILFAAILVSRRRPSRDDGVASFQRHLGALSPEARRQSIQRARKPDDRDDDGTGGR